ncbi:MAG TPA: outer membrane lipoprotein LolB [Usitatibacter sp.]|nr:outer membrane lipoprotein LolB [Usitatibacter sp.]
MLPAIAAARRAAACLLLIAAAGCATVAPLPQLASVPAAFETTGRLAVRQADRSDIAKVRWTHRAGHDVWIIASPLGNEVARIESTADGAVMNANGATVDAPSFADLTQRVLGIALDPALLMEWLHARADAGAPAGWKVSIDEVQDAGAVRLARRITATRGDVTVRWIVDSYDALPAS